MEQQALDAIATLVYERYGLRYMNNMDTLRIKLTARVKALKLASFMMYYQYLNQHEQEWSHVIEALTINETYFLREDKQLTIYKEKLLPTLLQKKQSVAIWSAACSTGEEPYSLAMLAHDQGVLPSEMHITATDIDMRVLARAQVGRYMKQSLAFRRTPIDWLEKYFDEEEAHYVVKRSIRNEVTFGQQNLLQLSTIPSEQYDIIFCRNVFIYFDDVTIEQIAQQFYRLLKKGGYLCLGHAETISKLHIGFQTIHDNGAFYYQKG